ncbi:MAG: ROK family protein [Janthinobacterium lividum]
MKAANRAAKKAVSKHAAGKRPASKKAASRQPAAGKRAVAVKRGTRTTSRPGILAIDIGGTGLKAAVLDDAGKMLTEKVRTPTPYPCPPEVMIETLVKLVATLTHPYDRISIGFPGVVRGNDVLTAPHFGTPEWAGFQLASTLAERLGGMPARLINDAEMQGLAAIEGKGLEFVLTLGTGAGTALFRQGELMPHLELAHHPAHKGKTYNEYIGDAALKKIGPKRWNRRVRKMLEVLDSLLHYDRLIIGGGNGAVLSGDLPPHVSVVSNDAGIEGGAALWRDPRAQAAPHAQAARAATLQRASRRGSVG